MALVFKNAMTFNSKGDTWYDEADRLNQSYQKSLEGQMMNG